MMREEFMRREQTLRAFAEQNAEINFSLGAVWTDEEISVEKLIAIADKAMYDAKRDYYQKYLHYYPYLYTPYQITIINIS